MNMENFRDSEGEARVMIEQDELMEMLFDEIAVLERAASQKTITRYAIRVELMYQILYDALDDFTKARIEKAIGKGA